MDSRRFHSACLSRYYELDAFYPPAGGYYYLNNYLLRVLAPVFIRLPVSLK